MWGPITDGFSKLKFMHEQQKLVKKERNLQSLEQGTKIPLEPPIFAYLLINKILVNIIALKIVLYIFIVST